MNGRGGEEKIEAIEGKEGFYILFASHNIPYTTRRLKKIK